jgi:hypothetical protein
MVHGPMSSPPPLPACPNCGRQIAAWKKEHCIYCGTAFPSGFKEGFQEPEALKWVDRPAIPPDAARKLEMMKVVPLEGTARARSLPALIGLLSLPVFGVLFYMLYALVRRIMPAASGIVLVIEAGILGYLAWAFYKARRA